MSSTSTVWSVPRSAPATIARLYTEFLTIVERSAPGERRTHEEWRLWVQQIMGILPH